MNQVHAKYSYVIYTPLYNENVGGYIVLHKLCSLLNEMGLHASIWHEERPHVSELLRLRAFKKLLRWIINYRIPAIFGRMSLKSPYHLKIASYKDLQNAVVVYPEVVDGNPLGSRRVVRWFLNKPGLLTGKVNYGLNEIYFYYGKHFNDPEINPEGSNKLFIMELLSSVYFDQQRSNRSGTCYIVRKGKDRQLTEHDSNAICIDGMSHSDIADVFAKCKYFISYDLYTMYSHYAAMCGCISVVVPAPGLAKEEWLSKAEDRYGIAYGWDDLSWAIDTRSDLLELQKKIESDSMLSVKEFNYKVQKHFLKIQACAK